MSSIVFDNIHLNFSFDTDSLFSKIETFLYHWARNDLSNVFDSVFEKCNVDDAEIHLENLDLDLGDIPESIFLSETCSRLKEKLKQFLYPSIEKQRKSTYLKILVNSCKKFAPEIKISQIEESFFSNFQFEESKNTIILNTISILKKKYPTLSFNEITEDVFYELNFIQSKKENVYLLNILKKLYFTFRHQKEDLFIQSFITTTIQHYCSDGYLDLLLHFVLKMQELHPDLNDPGISKNFFFKQLDNEGLNDLRQLFNDIFAIISPSVRAAFIDNFIKKVKECDPNITSLRITILFIDELKKNYPYLNDFRLSNFNESKSPNLSKIYWKNEIKEILWNIYKVFFQTEANSLTNIENHSLEDYHETISLDDDEQGYIEGSHAENIGAAIDKNSVHELQDDGNASNSKPLPEFADAENPAFNDGRKNHESASLDGDEQGYIEGSHAENIGTAIGKNSVHELQDDKSSTFFQNGNTDTNNIEQKVLENNIPQTSEKFDKIFNNCFTEFSSPEKNCSPLQITEHFIVKLQKEFPDKNAFAHIVQAYQKATELEMRCTLAADENNEISVKDAGLVLIGAYIPTLFKKLEYTTDGVFVSDKARMKASCLLQYMVFGDLPSDGLYFLANYFCELPWNFRLPNNIILDDNEKQIAESLISAVIENWKAIGHVSIDGFRGTFLHREGKIEKEGYDEVHLKINKGPFDMLLDTLPWSYSMLKFKWHKKLLSTTWR